MKKVLISSGIVLIILVAILFCYAVLGLKHSLNQVIYRVNLTAVKDGTYTGNFDCFRFSNSIKVTVKDHKITKLQPIKIQEGRRDLVKKLSNRVLEKQSPDVDAITGATASSKGFLKAVENALQSSGSKP